MIEAPRETTGSNRSLPGASRLRTPSAVPAQTIPRLSSKTDHSLPSERPSASVYVAMRCSRKRSSPPSEVPTQRLPSRSSSSDEDAIGREPVVLAVAHEAAVPKSEEPAVRADPEIVVAVAGEDPHECVRQTLRGAVEPRDASLDAGETPARSRPEARRIGQQRQHGAGKTVAHRPDLEALVLEAGRAPDASGPEGSRGILRESVDAAGREALRRGIGPDLAAGHARHAEARADPDAPIPPLQKRRDDRVRQPAGERRQKLAVPVPRESRDRADPEGPVARLEQRLDPVVVHRLRVSRVEDREADAVEAHQAFLGAHPEVAVTRLENRRDGVLGQPRVARPHVVAVLREGHGRIEPEHLAGGEAQQDGERQSNPDHGPEKPENPPRRNGRRIFRIGSGTNQGKFGTVRASQEA